MAHLTNFSFDISYKIFTEDAFLPFLYHGAKKSKMTKNSNQGAGPALKVQRTLALFSAWQHGQEYSTSAWVRGWYRYFLSLRNPLRRPRALAVRCGCAQCFLGSANVHMKLTDRGWKEAFVFRVVDVSFSSLSNRARAD